MGPAPCSAGKPLLEQDERFLLTQEALLCFAPKGLAYRKVQLMDSTQILFPTTPSLILRKGAPIKFFAKMDMLVLEEQKLGEENEANRLSSLSFSPPLSLTHDTRQVPGGENVEQRWNQLRKL